MGKPLISDAAMRGIFDTMQHLRTVKAEPRNRRALSTEQEALPAAILSQLHGRDTLILEGPQPLFEAARDSWFPDEHSGPTLLTCTGSSDECAAFAAGVALKSSTRGASRPVVVAILRTFPPLTAALQAIADHGLSLLLLTQAAPESRAAANHRASSTTVPIMPVDDSDAVAICRVFQESLLRARNGWGGAVIHAAHIPGTPDGIDGMRQRLQRRGLL